MTFNGFISYSHAADNQLAPAIQRGLHRLAKPWHRRRALWIFRDQTGLAVTPALWSSIKNALDGSDFFVLLASPEAARSPWVNREIEHWMLTKSPDRILPVVTDGHWQWDPERRDFTEDSTAVPAALRGAFREEPLYLDLRWARDDRHLSLRHSRFRDAIAQLAAPMHGVSKDDLEGEDVRQHRRARRLRSGALVTLVLLTFVAVLTGLMALRNADRANAAADEARRQQVAAAQQRNSAERSADEARRQQGLARDEQTRAREAAEETQRQEALARQQRALAAEASTEADKQQQLARAQQAVAAQARADAGRQQTNAKLQRQLADRAAARARKQEQLANQQRDLAKRWAAEAEREEQAAKQAAQDAARQQAKAEQQQRIAVGRRLINQAKATVAEDPQTALMLGTAADTIQHDPESHRALTGITTSTRYAGTVNGVVSATFGAGTTVAARDDDDVVSLWNVADRAHPVKLATLGGTAHAMAFSPDGRTLAVAPEAGRVTLWDVTNPAGPRRIGELPGLDQVYGVTFSPDGRTLAASADGTLPPPGPAFFDQIQLFDVSDPARVTHLSTLDLSDTTNQIVFSPDGRTMVVSAEEELTFWDVTDRAHPADVATRDHSLEQPIAFSPDQPLLAASEGDATAVLWDTTDPAKPQKTATLTVPDQVTSLAFEPGRQVLATGDISGTTTMWDIAKPAKPMALGTVTGSDAVAEMAYSADGRTLITAGIESVTLWNTADYGTPEPVAELGDGSAPALASAFDPTGRSLAAVRSDGTALFWDVTRPGRPAPSATVTVHDHGLYAAAISLDRRTVAAGGTDKRMTLTDVSDPRHPVTLATVAVPLPGLRPVEQFSDMTFSADGHLLAITGSYGNLMAYDLTDRTHPRLLFRTQAGAGTDYGAVAFSPDGKTLAAGDGAGRVHLLDLTRPDKPRPVAVLVGRRPLTGYSSIPLSFSPDGRTLVAGGSTDKAALLWDVSDRAHPARLATINHDSTMTSAMFSPDGHLMATQSDDHTLAMWDVTDPASPVRIASVRRSTLGRVLAVSPDGHTLLTGVPIRLNQLGTLWDYSRLNAIRADAAAQSCTMAGRGLTADEWSRYIPEVRYQPTCRG